MKLNQLITLTIASVLLTACEPAAETGTPAAAEATAPLAGVVELPVRYSVINLSDLDSPLKLTALCESENQLMREHMASLESYAGKATVDGYYKSLDSLATSLGNLSSYAQSLSSIHPDPELRTAGENCAQLLSEISTDLGLSRPIYEAISQLDVSNEVPATQHSIEKTLLAYRLSGVDKDEATRQRIRELNSELVNIGQTFVCVRINPMQSVSNHGKPLILPKRSRTKNSWSIPRKPANISTTTIPATVS